MQLINSGVNERKVYLTARRQERKDKFYLTARKQEPTASLMMKTLHRSTPASRKAWSSGTIDESERPAGIQKKQKLIRWERTTPKIKERTKRKDYDIREEKIQPILFASKSTRKVAVAKRNFRTVTTANRHSSVEKNRNSKIVSE